MSSPTSEADFGFWALTIPKNSEKKLEMEKENAVYHVSNVTLGNKVAGGRTTVSFKANGKQAPICNLVNNTLENASLDLIISRSMNPSFITKGPNAVTVLGYVQPLVDESDSDMPGVAGIQLTNGADGAVEMKASEAKGTAAPKESKPEANEKAQPKVKKSTAKEEAKPKPKEEAKESKKRKLDESKTTDVSKPPEKKRNKRKKKKKKNQKADEQASESKINGAGEPMEVDKASEEKLAKEENKNGMVKDNAESSKMEVEHKEKAKEDSSESKKKSEKEKIKEKPVEETSAGVTETPMKEKAAKESTPKSKSSKKSKKMLKAGKGVTYRVLKKGKAGVKPAKKGDSITLLYVGCLKDGKQFDKNLKDGLTFKIGGDEVIPGIELGVMGMCPKEKRRIIIPPEQGYGADGASEGQIPPNAELHFTVQRK